MIYRASQNYYNAILFHRERFMFKARMHAFLKLRPGVDDFSISIVIFFEIW